MRCLAAMAATPFVPRTIAWRIETYRILCSSCCAANCARCVVFVWCVYEPSHGASDRTGYCVVFVWCVYEPSHGASDRTGYCVVFVWCVYEPSHGASDRGCPHPLRPSKVRAPLAPGRWRPFRASFPGLLSESLFRDSFRVSFPSLFSESPFRVSIPSLHSESPFRVFFRVSIPSLHSESALRVSFPSLLSESPFRVST